MLELIVVILLMIFAAAFETAKTAFNVKSEDMTIIQAVSVAVPVVKASVIEDIRFVKTSTLNHLISVVKFVAHKTNQGINRMRTIFEATFPHPLLDFIYRINVYRDERINHAKTLDVVTTTRLLL